MTLARISTRLALAALALALSAPAARADSVVDERGVYGQVTVVALDDDQLVFIFNDGRTLQRRADTIRQIVLAPGNDAAADELTRAETLRDQGKRREAIELYQRVLTLTKKPFVRGYANMRLITLFDETGDLFKSFDACCRLAIDHPRLALVVYPRKFPRADSRVCRRILADIDRRSRSPQPDGVAAVLNRVRGAILRTPAADPPSASTATPPPAAPPAASQTPPSAAPKTPTTQSSPRVLLDARSAILRGDLATAARLAAEARRTVAKHAPDAVGLLEAELALARNEFRHAGLLAMNVVIQFPDAPSVPAALFIAGEAHERIGRPGKAADLYRRCIANRLADDAVKVRARLRLDALSAASRSPGAALTKIGS